MVSLAAHDAGGGLVFAVQIHHSHGVYVVSVAADCADDARREAREAALDEGLILYRVIVSGGPYGLPGGC